MHHFDVLLDLVRQQKGVGVGLSLGEDYDLTTLSVDDKDVSESRKTVLVWALDGQMLYGGCSLVLQVLGQIDDAHALLHMRRSHVSDPAGDSGREETDLEVSSTLLSAGAEDLNENKRLIFVRKTKNHLPCRPPP
jgi:hypothetical protein